MSKPYVMRPADTADLDAVMGLLDSRIRWLRARGSDQWSTGNTFRARLTDHMARQETWILFDDDSAIATITLTSYGDPDFWTCEELQDKALYVSKMATEIQREREGLGTLMLRWAQNKAAHDGVDVIRWDAWRTNSQLHDYYISVGARHVRTVAVPDRWSGALFEMSVSPDPALEAEVATG